MAKVGVSIAIGIMGVASLLLGIVIGAVGVLAMGDRDSSLPVIVVGMVLAASGLGLTVWMIIRVADSRTHGS